MLGNFEKIQIISLIGSLFFLIFIFELIRRKRIKEAYSILWLLFGLIFLFFSFWKNGLDYFSSIVGIYYPPAFLFLIMIVSIILILVQFSIIVSSQDEKIKKLAQEIAIMKEKYDKRSNTDKH
jgi:hypothetical protein